MGNLKENLSQTYALIMLILTYNYFIPQYDNHDNGVLYDYSSCKFTLQEAIYLKLYNWYQHNCPGFFFLNMGYVAHYSLRDMPKKSCVNFSSHISITKKNRTKNKETNKQTKINLHKRFAKSN